MFSLLLVVALVSPVEGFREFDGARPEACIPGNSAWPAGWCKKYEPIECSGDEEVFKAVVAASAATLQPLGMSATQIKEYYDHVFSAACARHDRCYRYGDKTYGLTQLDCDNEFWDRASDSCTELNVTNVIGNIVSVGIYAQACFAVAGTYYAALRAAGASSVRHESCCPYMLRQLSNKCMLELKGVDPRRLETRTPSIGTLMLLNP